MILVVVAFGTFTLSNFSAGNIGSGTLPTARGGTGLSSLGSAGQVMKVNTAGNALEFGNASSAEVYGFNLSYSPSTIFYNVAVQAVGGANKYFILGEQQKTLELLEGNTYIFDHPSAHPVKFSTDSGNSNAYTTGVTVVSSTRVQIVVASGAPTLYYYCNVHAGMEDKQILQFHLTIIYKYPPIKVRTTSPIINTLRLMMFYLVQADLRFHFQTAA